MSRLKVLIVENEAIVAEDICLSLVQDGYEVTGVARFGAEALVLARTCPPDIVLMDIHLSGGMDGLSTAKLLKEFHPTVEVIFITGQIPSTAALIAGNVISKPFTQDDLSVVLLRIQKNNDARVDNADSAARIESSNSDIDTGLGTKS